jgi:O-acetyl-ADP-ribose deacetylase (regulator of RNase III)
MNVDVIVNAANRSLLGGGGVDGAIHLAAGPELLEECRGLNGCETGQAKITGGYRLPARYVIHTVGPIWHGGGNHERELLASCYRNALELAAEYQAESIAFPMISAGAYGYPKDEAMEVAVETISRFLLQHEMTVYLVVFGRQEFFTGKKLFRDVQEYIDDHYAETHIQRNNEKRRAELWHRDEKAALEMDQRFLAEGRHFPKPVSAPKARPAPAERPKPAAKAKPVPDAPPCMDAAPSMDAAADIDWDKLVRRTDEGFSAALLRMIDERGMTDAQCYRKANVDRRLFSKIRSDPEYRPSKPTVFAFAVALELSLPETKEFLGKAGFALTHSSKMDLVLEYCIKERIYDVIRINEVLFDLDLPLLGNNSSAA